MSQAKIMRCPKPKQVERTIVALLDNYLSMPLLTVF